MVTTRCAPAQRCPCRLRQHLRECEHIGSPHPRASLLRTAVTPCGGHSWGPGGCCRVSIRSFTFSSVLCLWLVQRLSFGVILGLHISQKGLGEEVALFGFKCDWVSLGGRRSGDPFRVFCNLSCCSRRLRRPLSGYSATFCSQPRRIKPVGAWTTRPVMGTWSPFILGLSGAFCQLGQGASKYFPREAHCTYKCFPSWVTVIQTRWLVSFFGQNLVFGYSVPEHPSKYASGSAFGEVISCLWVVLTVWNHLLKLSPVLLAHWPVLQPLGPWVGIQQQTVPWKSPQQLPWSFELCVSGLCMMLSPLWAC